MGYIYQTMILYVYIKYIALYMYTHMCVYIYTYILCRYGIQLNITAIPYIPVLLPYITCLSCPCPCVWFCFIVVTPGWPEHSMRNLAELRQCEVRAYAENEVQFQICNLDGSTTTVGIHSAMPRWGNWKRKSNPFCKGRSLHRSHHPVLSGTWRTLLTSDECAWDQDTDLQVVILWAEDDDRVVIL